MENEYPKWKYRGAESRTVDNQDEEEALGEGWGDSPNWEAGADKAAEDNGGQGEAVDTQNEPMSGTTVMTDAEKAAAEEGEAKKAEQ